MNFKKSLFILTLEALIASIAATITLKLSFPVWIMFIGWVSFFSRSPCLKNGLLNTLSTISGVFIGIGATFFIKYFTPYMASYSLSLATFIVAVVVLSMGFFTKLNNVVAIFLGVITYFALHQPFSIENLISILGAISIGSLAGFLAFRAQKTITSSRIA